MARYHFNILHDWLDRDVDGTECPTLGHARREAVRQAGVRLMTEPHRFWNGRNWTLEAVRDGHGAVFNLHFAAEEVTPPEWLED